MLTLPLRQLAGVLRTVLLTSHTVYTVQHLLRPLRRVRVPVAWEFYDSFGTRSTRGQRVGIIREFVLVQTPTIRPCPVKSYSQP